MNNSGEKFDDWFPDPIKETLHFIHSKLHATTTTTNRTLPTYVFCHCKAGIDRGGEVYIFFLQISINNIIYLSNSI